MLMGEFEEMNHASVSNIIQLGGTILKTARSEEFLQREERAKAARLLAEAGIEGLVAIGGDGTFRGAHDLLEEHAIPIIGVPGTIDNDLWGTDETIGYDTAVNTALDAIECTRDSSTRPVSRARTSVLQHFLDRIHDWRDLCQGPPILFTIEDIAEMFDVSRETVLGWLRAGMPYRERGCFDTGEGFKLVLSWVIDWTFALNMLVRAFGDHQGRRELRLP